MLGLLAACDIGRVDSFTVVNRTEHDLQLAYLNPNGEDNLGRISAGATGTASPFLCTRFPVVARTDDGTEVARRDPPICEGDTWTIEEP